METRVKKRRGWGKKFSKHRLYELKLINQSNSFILKAGKAESEPESCFVSIDRSSATEEEQKCNGGYNCNYKNTDAVMEKSATPTTGKVRKHIPLDVSFSILSKLPPKSLRRFQCVSKSWSMLFQNPYFKRIYGNHIIHRRNHSDYDDASIILGHTILEPVHGSDEELWITTLYFISGKRFEKRVELNLSLPKEVLGSDICILGSISINGILCLSNILFPWRKFVLWNPITNEFNVIPPSPVESVPCTMVIPLIHGIGYDRLRDDYKVIRHVQFDSRSFEHLFDRELSMEEQLSISNEPLWEIYSLRSNSWKKVDVDMSMVMSPGNEDNIARFYNDGMCHWWDKVEKDSSDETYFVSFDVSNEVFFTTPMPLDIDDTFDLRLVKRHLVMLNGSIALISYSGETTSLHISILGEIGVKESWTKLFIVEPLPHVDYPIGAGKNGDIFFVNNDGELACFNLVTQTIKELGVEGLMSEIVIYKENILSMSGINS